MKIKTILLILTLILNSCSAEKRIYEYSYTKLWYNLELKKYEYKQNKSNPYYYQVYQTARNQKYILILNKKQSKIIRKYIR